MRVSNKLSTWVRIEPEQNVEAWQLRHLPTFHKFTLHSPHRGSFDKCAIRDVTSNNLCLDAKKCKRYIRFAKKPMAAPFHRCDETFSWMKMVRRIISWSVSVCVSGYLGPLLHELLCQFAMYRSNDTIHVITVTSIVLVAFAMDSVLFLTHAFARKLLLMLCSQHKDT